MGWISVDDNLPKDYVSVLACTSSRIFIGHHFDKYWMDGELDMVWDVTHWRPLPEFPAL